MYRYNYFSDCLVQLCAYIFFYATWNHTTDITEIPFLMKNIQISD